MSNPAVRQPVYGCMLQLAGIRKSFGSHLVLNIPDFTFQPGVYWIRGGNGSGKTTLLKILAGLVPFQGAITLDSHIDIERQKVRYRQCVNYAEAEPLYPSFLSGHDLTELYKVTKSADPDVVTGLVRSFALDGYLRNPVGTYSSGMTKKLSLVLAFIGKPRVVLLDEPLVTLEDSSIPILYDLIRNYRDAGVTFLMTSHQPVEELQFPGIHHILVKDQQLWIQ